MQEKNQLKELSITQSGDAKALINQTIVTYHIEGGIDGNASNSPGRIMPPKVPAGQKILSAIIGAVFSGQEIAELHFSLQKTGDGSYGVWISNCISQGRYAIGEIEIIWLHG